MTNEALIGNTIELHTDGALFYMKTITRYFRKKFGNDPERQCCEITCDVCGSKTTAHAGIDAFRMVDQSCQQCINTYGRRKAYELHNPQ